MAERDGIWFEYQVTRGRFTAVPVSATGWAVFMGVLLVPLGICLALAPAVMAVHPLLLFPLILAAIAISFAMIFTLVRRKGRRVSP